MTDKKIPKSLEKIMSSKLDKLPLSVWAEADTLWEKLKEIITTGKTRE